MIFFPRIRYKLTGIRYTRNKGKMCMLCLKKKPLQRESYIVPRFLYKGVFDEDNKLNKLMPFEYVNENGTVTRPSSGEYDEWILCRECEVKISKYESFGATTFFGNKSKLKKQPKVNNYVIGGNKKYFLVQNLDYSKFKLFLLTILWKTAATDREFGKDINIGWLEEVLRIMIRREVPGKFQDFPIVIFSMLQHKNIESGFIAQPASIKFKGYNACLFPIRGFWICFVIALNVKDEFIRQCTVNYNDECKILQIEEQLAKQSLLAYFGL